MSFTDIVLGFIEGPDSAELQQMKEMMNKIDYLFNRLNSSFNDIVRLINWNVVRIDFGQLEQKILAMSEKYANLYKVPPAAATDWKIIFVDAYESDYQNTGYQLYQAIITPIGVFHEMFGNFVMRSTHNDRKGTQIIILGTLQLLLQAAKVELAYLRAKNFTHNAEFTKGVWETR